MRWIGAMVGGYVGSSILRGGVLGLIGFVAGAIVGNKVEEAIFGKRRGAGGRDYAAMSERERSKVFFGSVAAMLAKMAKADGRVTRDEIAAVEVAFKRFGFSPSARAYAIGVFRQAKDDSHTIYEYARDFAQVVSSVEVREILYEILWDLARTDGSISLEELNILERIPDALGIHREWFSYFASGRSRAHAGSASPARNELADAYATLGVDASASDDAVRRQYRELAKKNHPDALRAQGLPEAMIGKATERMSRINAAWEAIKRARGL